MAVSFYEWVEDAAYHGRYEMWLPDLHKSNEFLTRFNNEIGELLQRFGEEAIARAVRFHYGCSGGTVWDATEPTLGYARISFMESVKTLYTRGFATSCSNYLGHLDGPKPARPLNSQCYMLWDMDGIECRALHDDEEMAGLSFEVLRHALSISHPACQESALHGLGHLAMAHKDQVRSIIQHEFLQAHRILPELVDYAKSAAQGAVE